jgi:triosephosphate isomerase
VAGYVKEDRIDGVLVGGASLNASDFIKIIEKVHENSA